MSPEAKAEQSCEGNIAQRRLSSFQAEAEAGRQRDTRKCVETDRERLADRQREKEKERGRETGRQTETEKQQFLQCHSPSGVRSEHSKTTTTTTSACLSPRLLPRLAAQA